MVSPRTGLRNVPRQKRSEAKIDHILDAVERVVQRMGYDAVTTNHVAAEAKISIGTLYHWFPDKGALADGLTARQIDRLAEEIADRVVDEPELDGPQLIERLVSAMAKFVIAHPSLPEIVRSSAGHANPSGTFRAAISAQCEQIIEKRVLGIPDAEKKLTADACATIVLAFLCESSRGPTDAAWVAELSYVLTAYITGAKYPPADDPIWDDPESAQPTKPVRPGLPRSLRKRSR